MSFQERVLDLVGKVPKGRVVTYSQVARALDRPGASRAVGNALAKNPRPVEIPCHRVVRSDGRVGGYGRGQERKIELLRNEEVEVDDGKVDLEKYRLEELGGLI